MQRLYAGRTLITALDTTPMKKLTILKVGGSKISRLILSESNIIEILETD